MEQNPPPPGWYPSASGPLFTERSLVFHQPAGILVHHSFSILDGTGRLVGTVEGVGGGPYRRAVSHRIELRSATGELVLTIVAVPWKFESYRIEWPSLGSVGEIRAKLFGPKFVFFSNHQRIGLIRRTSWCDFTVEDEVGRRIAGINYSRLSSHIMALPESHTTLEREHPLTQPMSSLVLASGVIVNKLATRRKPV